MRKQVFQILRKLCCGVNKGFTLIELLIVVAILGILVAAVLAIDPLEQINRGRDSGSRTDAKQLLDAVDRFYGFQGYYPWKTGASDTSASKLEEALLEWSEPESLVDTGGTCMVSEKLSTSNVPGCVGADELKEIFFNKIFDSGYNHFSIYNQGGQGQSTYICFVPQSKAFVVEAQSRCEDALGTGLPGDIPESVREQICGNYEDPSATNPIYTCLP